MTPREYLNYVGQLFALSDAERRERVEEVLSRVGLKEAARQGATKYCNCWRTCAAK